MRIICWTNDFVPYEAGLPLSDLAFLTHCWYMVDAGAPSSDSIKQLTAAACDDIVESALAVSARPQEVVRRRKVLAIRRQIRHKRYETDWRIEFILDRILEDFIS